MACAAEYNDEQLNYYRICYLTTDILAEGLRTIFKQEWDNRYKATKGEWKDEPRNGLDFYNGESPRNQRRNSLLLATMINGNRAEWDCTMLFYAILNSDCIYGLNTAVYSNVSDLRTFRNEQFAHIPRGHLSGLEFQNAIGKVHTAFQGLGLSTVQIQDIRNQTSFPTEELRNVLDNVEDLKRELQEKGKELQEKEEQRQVLEDQLQSDASPFCILPTKPSHDVARRDCEVDAITQQLKELRCANENGLSYLYISGNPGSGKSQLAGFVAKRFFDEVSNVPSATTFVMTLNGDSLDTLLESYASFARHLKCPEYAVTNALNAKDGNINGKITNLKTLISTKIELYTSWLLVVDNVTSISSVHVHLPQPGSEQWIRGQLLITTQDTASIPLKSSFIDHISISEGMDPHEAISLLTMLSGVADSEMEKEVAQALDFQPLALASAATYVRQVRQNKVTSNFGWNDYLEKLNKGQRCSTETILAETNASYQESMTTATTLAVEKAMTSDKVIRHTFNFLSLCAPKPLSLDIVINYILNVDEEIDDKAMIGNRIQRCSLLLLEEEETGVHIRVHQVVHDVINAVVQDYPMIQQLEAIRSFDQFIGDILDGNSDELDSLVSNKEIVPHLKALIVKIEILFSEEEISKVVKNHALNLQCFPRIFQNLGRVSQNHCEFYTAMKYFKVALEFVKRSKLLSGVDEANANFYMGTVHQDLGDPLQAREYYERELAIRKKKQGRNHVDVAVTYGNLGNVHLDLGELKQAKSYYDHALIIIIEKLGPDHIHAAATYNNLGNVHLELGNLKQAKVYYCHALTIRLGELGSEHVHVAASYGNLGKVYRKLDKLEEAKECYNCALAIRLKKLGPEHVDVATTYNNLGIVHLMSGVPEQAKECFDRALAINLKKLGSNHVHVAVTYNNLANVHADLGDLELAKEYYDRALAIGHSLAELQEQSREHSRSRGTTCTVL
ncbi:uncharacterized protein LOC110052008 [Orbicella faveolata]|uniref:uncharacterized protein LOC110052008 n=1 Tax=Orbicella faveolata TaxID=48498 RepID=UPI0009E3F105|nr:uncharacterized protein LOC110052008 [Orbicella faveolata]XP_020613784.1 uncharacterized protein LOC110052008 [Orbicella faveolata]